MYHENILHAVSTRYIKQIESFEIMDQVEISNRYSKILHSKTILKIGKVKAAFLYSQL